MYCALFLTELRAQHGPPGHTAPAAASKKGMVLATSCESSRPPSCVGLHHDLCLRHVHWRQLRLPPSFGNCLLDCIDEHGARFSCDKEARVQACHAVQKPDALVVVAAASFRLLAKPPCICHLASLLVTSVVDYISL